MIFSKKRKRCLLIQKEIQTQAIPHPTDSSLPYPRLKEPRILPPTMDRSPKEQQEWSADTDGGLKGRGPLSPDGTTGWRHGPTSQARRLRLREIK